MNHHRREQPPADVKRQLRQEAGFGCCRCGYPFFQYHHIVPWHVDNHFRPEDMMTLCPNCHDEVTIGKAPEHKQRSWKASPVNIEEGVASGRLRVDQRLLIIDAGTNIFIDTPVVIQINGEDLISMRVSENGNLLVSAKSYDLQNNLIFQIVDNEWITGNELPWDLDAKWRHVVLRHKLRDVGFEIDARADPIIIRGTFSRDGHSVRVSRNCIEDNRGNKLINCRVESCGAGYVFSGPQMPRWWSMGVSIHN